MTVSLDTATREWDNALILPGLRLRVWSRSRVRRRCDVPQPGPCIVCLTDPVVARHRCQICVRYLRRTGYDRTAEQVEAWLLRRHERRLVSA